MEMIQRALVAIMVMLLAGAAFPSAVSASADSLAPAPSPTSDGACIIYMDLLHSNILIFIYIFSIMKYSYIYYFFFFLVIYRNDNRSRNSIRSNAAGFGAHIYNSLDNFLKYHIIN